MLKVIALAACVIGFVFLVPKALAEFRQPRSRTRVGRNMRAKNRTTRAA